MLDRNRPICAHVEGGTACMDARLVATDLRSDDPYTWVAIVDIGDRELVALVNPGNGVGYDCEHFQKRRFHFVNRTKKVSGWIALRSLEGKWVPVAAPKLFGSEDEAKSSYGLTGEVVFTEISVDVPEM